MTIETINVILCCYQGEAYLAEQLDSILNQDYPSVEIYISDDCSTDNTGAIVEAYCTKFSNVTLHKNTNNLGFLKNFETSLLRAEGKYFALSDQDDIWHPNKLKTLMNELVLIEGNYPDKPILIHSDLELIDEKGALTENSFFAKKGLSLSTERSLPQILGHCGVMGNTILMNRHLIDKALPFPENLKYHDYWLALINECYGIRKTISKPLVRYRLHQTNTSNNNRAQKSVKSLPFMQDDRVTTIKYLLENYDLSEEDRHLIKRFYNYLVFEKSRFSHFLFLFNNGFFKSSVLYKINAFIRIMSTKYNNQ